MSKNKTLFLRDDAKRGVKQKTKNKTTLATIDCKLFEEEFVKKPQEGISDDFVYNLWASPGLSQVRSKIAMRHPGKRGHMLGHFGLVARARGSVRNLGFPN